MLLSPKDRTLLRTISLRPYGVSVEHLARESYCIPIEEMERRLSELPQGLVEFFTGSLRGNQPGKRLVRLTAAGRIQMARSCQKCKRVLKSSYSNTCRNCAKAFNAPPRMPGSRPSKKRAS